MVETDKEVVGSAWCALGTIGLGRHVATVHTCCGVLVVIALRRAETSEPATHGLVSLNVQMTKAEKERAKKEKAKAFHANQEGKKKK